MPTDTPESPGPALFAERLSDLFALWGVPEIAVELSVEYSTRMTRSLGRAYPERCLVRIAAPLRHGPAEFLDEILCHEAAHVAVFRLHGRSARPHGPEWQGLVRLAGYEPSTRLRVPEGIPGLPVHGPARRRRRRRRRPFLRIGRWRISFEKLGL